ncbi:MAG: hypothetical protein ACRCX2_03825 [Paraclostridium sp.]
MQFAVLYTLLCFLVLKIIILGGCEGKEIEKELDRELRLSKYIK